MQDNQKLYRLWLEETANDDATQKELRAMKKDLARALARLDALENKSDDER